MHDSSLCAMRRFAERLDSQRDLTIADIGACDVNGSYRAIFDRPPWRYSGCDLEPGPNVDIVLPDPYGWHGIGPFDVVVSGQCLEHVPQPWRWISGVFQVTKPGGLVCIIAPHTWPFREYPIDAWRVWPDGLRGLFDWAGLEAVEIYKNENDTVGIARRPI